MDITKIFNDIRSHIKDWENKIKILKNQIKKELKITKYTSILFDPQKTEVQDAVNDLWLTVSVKGYIPYLFEHGVATHGLDHFVNANLVFVGRAKAKYAYENKISAFDLLLL